MKNFFLKKIAGEALNENVALKVRQLYTPPAVARGDRNYWPALEQRIMARVTDPDFTSSLEPQRWWVVLGGWSRGGLIAAGVAVAISALLIQNQALDDSSAIYEYVSATPAPDALTPSVELVTQVELNLQDDAVINYVLSR